MSIAEQVLANQNIKEMTRRAIQTLKSLGEDASDLEEKFEKTYNEKV